MKIENENLTDQPDTMLEELAFESLKKRVTALLAKYPEHNTDQQAYQDRLFSELDIIKQTQLSGYFLMLSDIVSWAKDHDIPVGPGRGTIVGSLVAYAIRITDIDPLRYNLLFERCLSLERRIMPEVDIDFCIDRRDKVVQYVMKKYGGDLDNDGCRLRIHLPVIHTECKQLAAEHIDMLFHALCALGFPVGLQKAAEGMGMPGKTDGMCGMEAPKQWAAGKYEKVIDYCVQDVRVTLNLAIECSKLQKLQWVTQKGIKRKLPLPSGWLSVTDALQLPEPDTSWMTNPPNRYTITAWMNNDTQ